MNFMQLHRNTLRIYDACCRACLRSIYVISMKELHDERLDIPVLSVCSVVCDVQMIEVIRKESR
jgi:hypothetical protein